MCLAGSGTVGGGGSAASRVAAAEENGGEGAPVGTGQGGEVCELREDEAELEVGSAWAEEGWWLVDGEVELVGARVGGGGVLEVWGRELAKE